MQICEWCGSNEVSEYRGNVYWELPDGTKAIEITDTPSINCKGCGITYQAEEIIEQIEEQLLLIDTKPLGKSLTFSELMEKPRWLKKNYFKFD